MVQKEQKQGGGANLERRRKGAYCFHFIFNILENHVCFSARDLFLEFLIRKNFLFQTGGHVLFKVHNKNVKKRN